MLKRMLILHILFALLISNSFPVGAISYSEKLSPAIDILQRKQILTKANLAGSSITFSQEDFNQIIGSGYESLIIKTLPESNLGVLKLEGIEIRKGQSVTRESLDKLTFIPTGTEKGQTEFQFYEPFEKSEYAYTCLLQYTEDKAHPIESQSLQYETYQNVKISAMIDLDSEQKIEVEKNCQHGILTLDRNTGKFTYAPETNFTGTDRFYYYIQDEYGNKSDEESVSIRIEKEDKNLYFHDMADHALHKEAIALCSAGILDYELDQNGLPIFCPDQTVSQLEYEQSLDLLYEAMVKNGADKEVSVLITETDHVTKEQCLVLLYEYYADVIRN